MGVQPRLLSKILSGKKLEQNKTLNNVYCAPLRAGSHPEQCPPLSQESRQFFSASLRCTLLLHADCWSVLSEPVSTLQMRKADFGRLACVPFIPTGRTRLNDCSGHYMATSYPSQVSVKLLLHCALIP